MKTKDRNNKRRATRKLQAHLASKSPTIIVCAVCGKGVGKYKCPKCRAPFCCVQCSKDHKATACPAIMTSTSSTTAALSTTAGTTSSAPSTTTASGETSKYLSPSCILSTTTNHQHPPMRLRRKKNDDDEYGSHDDEPGWNITPEMKARIQQSKWLRKELQDGGLRQLIDTIDAASDLEDEDKDECDEKKDDTYHRGRNHWNQKKKNTNPNATKISPRELALARTRHNHPKFASFTDQLLLFAGVLQPAGAEAGGGEVTISEDGMMLDGNHHHGNLVLAPIPRLNRTVLKSSESRSEEEDDGSNNSGGSSDDDDSEDSSSSSSSDEDSDEGNDDDICNKKH